MQPTAFGSCMPRLMPHVSRTQHMAIQLASQKALRAVQSLPFCYLCARQFQRGDATNRDHVPPSALFARDDRDFPLILPAHQASNHRQSAHDEVVGQFVGLLHGRPVAQNGRKPQFATGTFDDASFGYGALGLDIKAIIWRWVRAFHAALYQSPVRRSGFSVFPPLPEGRAVGDRIEAVAVPEVIPNLVREIRRNRETGSLDSVVCRNGRCRYECVWTQADAGQWFCIWALDVYGWSELGDVTHFERRGCVGSYRLQEQPVPMGAVVGTRLHFTISNEASLNPFEGAG